MQVPVRRPSLPARKDVLYFVLFLTLFLAVFNDFFFSDRAFYERDMTVVEIPARKLFVDLMKEGNWALWTDAYGNGQPFLANPKNAVLYPSSLIYLVLPFFQAFKLHYLIHVLLLWLGLYRLCKSYSMTHESSFLGSSLFVFSGMYLSSFEFYNHIAALAWLPWILLILARGAPPKFSRILGLSVFWTLMLLAGAPEITLISAILALALAFERREETKKRCLMVFSSLILACLFSAVQLIPSFELLKRTERRSESTTWPLELIQLINMPFPHFLGNDRQPGHNDYWGWHLFDKKFPLYYSLYMGVGTLLLALFSLRRPIDRRRLIFLLLFVLFFLISCGRYSPFFFLYRYIPLLSSIRYPVKFFLGAVFCISILAAFGVDDLLKGKRVGNAFGRICLMVSAFCSILYWPLKRPILAILNKLFIIDEEALYHGLGRSIETGILLLTVYSLIFFFIARVKAKVRPIILMLIALVILDPAWHNRVINPTVPTSFFEKPALMSEFNPPLIVYREGVIPPFFKETVADNIRLLGYFRETLYPFTGIGEGVRYVFNRDFYKTYPSSFLKMMDAVHQLSVDKQNKILKYLGCAFHIGHERYFFTDESRKLNVRGLEAWIEPITESRPYPYVCFQTITAATMGEKLIAFIDDSFDPFSKVILDNPVGNLRKAEALVPPPVTILEETQGIQKFSLNLDREAILVVPGNYAPGWRAWINGKQTDVFEANLFSKGILVPQGQHEIVLKYLPRSLLWGVGVSFLALAVASLIFFITRIRDKKRAIR